jgi:Zn-finger nucleic acid-binding protein
MTQKRLMLVAAATFAAFMTHAVASRADTISYADAVTALAKECGADIKKHCKGINLGGGEIESCLEENAAKVSPSCTSTLSGVVASIRERQEAQRAYSKVCQHDMSQFCNGVVGDGNILACLIETSRVDGRKCDQAITDAGWR